MSDLRALTLAAQDSLQESDLPKLKFPVLGSPKIDGYRVGVQSLQRALSRSMKPVANRYVDKLLCQLPAGFDGELTVGPAWADDVFNTTGSAMRTAIGEPQFVLNTFDRLDLPGQPYEERLHRTTIAANSLGYEWLTPLEHFRCDTPEQVLAWENKWVAMGYEGLMVRSPTALYLEGRSGYQQGRAKPGALLDGVLMRFKRFYTSEFRVLEVLQGMKNNNVATKNSLGRTTRPTHAENLIPSGLCGGFAAEDIVTGQRFSVAPGKMTHEQSAEVWCNRLQYIGKIGTYRFDKKGGYLLPRFPTFQGWRDDL